MSNPRYVYKEFRKKPKVNPEVIRKAKHLLEVYGEIPKPLLSVGYMKLIVSGMNRYNGWVMLDDRCWRFMIQAIRFRLGTSIPETAVVTQLSIQTYPSGKLIYQMKDRFGTRWDTISSADLSKSTWLTLDCPFLEESRAPDAYINPKKVFDDIPTKSNYQGTIVPSPIRHQWMFPTWLSNSQGHLYYKCLESDLISHERTGFIPFLRQDNEFDFRIKGADYVYAHVVFAYSKN